MKSLWKSDCASLLLSFISPALVAATGTQYSSYLPTAAFPTQLLFSFCLEDHGPWCTMPSCCVCYLAVVSRNNFEVRWYSWPRSSFSKAFFLNLNASNFTLPEPQLLLCKIWHFKLLMNPSWRWNSGLCIEDVERRHIFLPVNPSTRMLHQPRDRTEI